MSTATMPATLAPIHTDRDAAVRQLTDVLWKFTAYIGKRLPTDVTHKLADLRGKETHPLAKAVYESMRENQEAADKLDRPSCQDTGVIQYFINAGARFPLLGELEDILAAATREATVQGPLRHNAVETFDEKNPAPTPAAGFPGWTGRSTPRATAAPSTSTWPAAAAPCPGPPRC